MPATYADLTTADANPLKRFVQRRRLADALGVLRSVPADIQLSVLDYGGADGQLTRLVAERLPRANVVCYEPTPHLAAEASERLGQLPNARVVRSTDGLPAGGFDYCFCLEVLEHLNPALTDEALRRIGGLLRPGGTCVIGVPNEIHLPALFKGLFRMLRRPGQFDTRLANILRATLGRPPVDRPQGEIADGLPYHFFHMGFDYRRLRETLASRFKVERIYGSPFRWAPIGINSEVYFVVNSRRG
jgi:SAM-dependent methyltransferase